MLMVRNVKMLSNLEEILFLRLNEITTQIYAFWRPAKISEFSFNAFRNHFTPPVHESNKKHYFSWSLYLCESRIVQWNYVHSKLKLFLVIQTPLNYFYFYRVWKNTFITHSLSYVKLLSSKNFITALKI